MISAIRDIGAYLRENNGVTEIDIVRSLVNKIEGDAVKEILLIDIKDNGEIETQSEEFYGDITTKALFYSNRRGFQGSLIRVYQGKMDDIAKTMNFCEIDKSMIEKIKYTIEEKLKSGSSEFVAVLLIDGKYANELFTKKFLNYMYEKPFSKITGQDHVCHLCGQTGEGYNTVNYPFYTNDKQVYGNIDDKDKSGVIVCKKCLDDLIIGRSYAEKILTTYWMGKNVMFIPHNFNKTIDGIYNTSDIEGNSKKNFIKNISVNEESVLEMLDKGESETDIIFYRYDSKAKLIEIYHTIKSMLPSRFGKLASLLEFYNIKLFQIIMFTTAMKTGVNGVGTTDKEKLKIVDSIFTARKIERNIFFTRAMLVYRYEFIHGKSKFTINNISKVYNFLVDCGCLEGGFNVMGKYSDYKEMLIDNEDYFKSNEKKAWFLIGMAYNSVSYMIKKDNSNEEGKLADRSSLDKNFFFARKFDFKDFIYFSNLLSDKMEKYKITSRWLKDILTEAKELMAKPNGKLSSDEAKYIFFWGKDSYFKKEESIGLDLNNNKDEGVEENREEI